MKNLFLSAQRRMALLWVCAICFLINLCVSGSAFATANAAVSAAVDDVEDTVGVVVTALVTLLVTFLGVAFIKRIRRA